MKANELMIGDVILYKNFKGNLMPHKIIGISEAYAEFEDPPYNMYQYEKMYPIPLTPEILEKNGFVYADLPFEDFYEGYGLHIHGGNYADGHSNWYIICGTNVSMNVTHVHELQHVFKLCGIEKDVIL